MEWKVSGVAHTQQKTAECPGAGGNVIQCILSFYPVNRRAIGSRLAFTDAF